MRIFTDFLTAVLVANFAFAGFQKWKYTVYDRFRGNRAPDQIQMHPDRDTIAQLMPARRIQ